MLACTAALGALSPSNRQSSTLDPAGISTQHEVITLQNSSATCGVIVSTWNTTLEQLSDLRSRIPHHCSLLVYDKGPGAPCEGSRIPATMQCVDMPNWCEDWNPTWLRHVIEHYDNLPDFLFAIPSNFDKSDRLDLLASDCRRRSFGADASDFCCPHTWDAETLKGGGSLSEYTDPARRDGRPFARWLSQYLQLEAPDPRFATPVCAYSLFGTTAHNVRSRPLSLYTRLYEQLLSNKASRSIDLWFMEWGARAVFGAAAMQREADLIALGASESAETRMRTNS